MITKQKVITHWCIKTCGLVWHLSHCMTNWGYHKIKCLRVCCLYWIPKNKTINHQSRTNITSNQWLWLWLFQSQHRSFRTLNCQQGTQIFRQGWVKMRNWHLVLMGNASYCDFDKLLFILCIHYNKNLSHALMVYYFNEKLIDTACAILIKQKINFEFNVEALARTTIPNTLQHRDKH